MTKDEEASMLEGMWGSNKANKSRSNDLLRHELLEGFILAEASKDEPLAQMQPGFKQRSISRYQTDAIFHRRIDSYVSGVMHIVTKHLKQTKEWHPIQTAPTDGTRIIGYSKTAKKRRLNPIRITWFRQKKDKAGYIGWGEFNPQHWPPTHWMKFPDEPVI